MSDKPEMPHEGGSYIQKPDGSLERTEWTRQPGDPGYSPPPAEKHAPARKPAAEKKPAAEGDR